jgi:NIPSNAP
MEGPLHQALAVHARAADTFAHSCHMEDKPMIYEVRTYTLRPGAVAEFEERFAKRLALREKHSKLGAFWHTEFGPLNQVIHVYPYENR